jgi:hypothetical protein
MVGAAVSTLNDANVKIDDERCYPKEKRQAKKRQIYSPEWRASVHQRGKIRVVQPSKRSASRCAEY